MVNSIYPEKRYTRTLGVGNCVETIVNEYNEGEGTFG